MESIYTADENRYAGMTYRRCGRSGITGHFFRVMA